MLFIIPLLFVGLAWAKEGGVCEGGSRCGPGQCCMTVVPRRGKRFSAFSYASTCQRMGTEGGKCYYKAMPASDGKYIDQCPCAPGYTCQSTGIREIPQGMIGVCKKITVNKPCDTGANCGPDECCKSSLVPIGKRQIHRGTCTRMGYAGSSCYTMYTSGKTNNVFFGCPCAAGLTCVSNGMVDIPMGKLGFCSRPR